MNRYPVGSRLSAIVLGSCLVSCCATMSWNATAQEIAPGDLPGQGLPSQRLPGRGLPDPGLRAQELVDLGLRNLGKSDLEKYHAAAIEQWSPAIAELEAKDQAETHPDNSILFVGSSSIRRWDDIATDMAPYHPIQRGYGGAKWTDVAIFAERLIAPHKFRAVVFFVGNDITGAAEDRTPEEVATLFAYVLARVREHDAMAPVFYVAVTPTESRWHAWPQIRAGNMAVRQLCERLKNTYFIGTESLYLDAKGYPRPELFVADKLHLSRSGYLHWSAAIKSHLDTVVQSPILPRFTGQTDATAGQ